MSNFTHKMPAANSAKNYTEDYADGHNQYICMCYKCNESFYGYKNELFVKNVY